MNGENVNLHYILVIIFFSYYKYLKKFPGKWNSSGSNDLQYQNAYKITDCTKRRERSGPNLIPALFYREECENQRRKPNFCKAQALEEFSVVKIPRVPLLEVITHLICTSL